MSGERPWTQQECQALLDRLREGEAYPRVASALGRTEEECRTQADALRQLGWSAAGATRRMHAPPQSRRCLRCRDPFAPKARFNFLCAGCGAVAASVTA